MDHKTMTALPPRGKIEWNLNTIIQLVTLAGMVVGGVAIWVNNDRDISELQDWRKSHEILHKDRLAEVKEKEGAYNARLSSIEGDIRKMDNLNYRITVLEQNRDALAKSFSEMQTAIQQLASDQRVSTEILKRLDAMIAGKQR